MARGSPDRYEGRGGAGRGAQLGADQMMLIIVMCFNRSIRKKDGFGNSICFNQDNDGSDTVCLSTNLLGR